MNLLCMLFCIVATILLCLQIKGVKGQKSPKMLWSSERVKIRSSGIYSAPALPERQRHHRGYISSSRIVSFKLPHFVSSFDSNDAKREITIMDIGRGNLASISIRNHAVLRSHRGITNKAEALAVDWTTGNIYWTDEGRNWIFVSTSNFKHTRAITRSVDFPKGIAVYPQKGLLFWSQLSFDDNGPRIMRSTMSGDKPTVVATPYGTPSAIALDYDTDSIYWIDVSDMSIHRKSIEKKTKEEVIYSNDRLSLMDLHVFRDWIYVTATAENLILMLNKTNGEVIQKINTTSPIGITIQGGNSQPKHSGSCDIKNGGCEQFCFAQPPGNQRKCGCSLGMELGSDGKSCTSNIMKKDFFLVVDSDMQWIFQISSNGNTFAKLPLPALSIPIQAEYDPATERVYWTDMGHHSVNRANLDGSNHVVLAKRNVRQPTGIAFDRYSRNVYWVDEGLSTINVIRADGTHRKTLLSSNISLPRGLVLDPASGLMWWSDWGKKTIERAAMDGTNRRVIIDEDMSWVNGLAVDFASNRLYWCDAKRDTIESSNLNGTDRQLVKYLASSRSHVFGISLTKDYIYWSDWNRPTILRVPKKNSEIEPQKFGPSIFDKPSDIHAYIGEENIIISKDANPCQIANGNCSGLCIPVPRHRTTANNISANDELEESLSTRVCVCGDTYKGSCDRPSNKTDGEPPSFGESCPKSLEFVAAPCDNTVLVNYTMPKATDNSGKVKLEMPANPPPLKLTEGSYEHKYTAIDGAGNHDVCQFTITVKVIRCPPPIDYIGFLPVSLVNSSCGRLFGSRVQLQCKNATADDKPQYMECEHDGEWSGDPICNAEIGIISPAPTNATPKENATQAYTLPETTENSTSSNILVPADAAKAVPYNILIPVIIAIIVVIFIGIVFKYYRNNSIPLMAAMEKTLSYRKSDDDADTFTLDVSGDNHQTDVVRFYQKNTINRPTTSSAKTENNKQSDLPVGKSSSSSDVAFENFAVNDSTKYGTL